MHRSFSITAWGFCRHRPTDQRHVAQSYTLFCIGAVGLEPLLCGGPHIGARAVHPRSVDVLRRPRTRSGPSVPTSGAQRLVSIRRARRPSPPVTCAERRSTREARAFFAPFWTIRLRPNRAQSSFQHPYFAQFRVRSSVMCSQVLFLACDGVGAWQVAPTRCFGAGAAQIFVGEGLASRHASPINPRGRGSGSVPRRRPSGRRSVLHRTVGHHCLGTHAQSSNSPGSARF